MRRSEYLIGKLAGSIRFVDHADADSDCLYIAESIRVNWGNIGLVLLITVIYGMAVGAISLAMGLLAQNQTSVSSYSSIILMGVEFPWRKSHLH